MRAAFIRQPGAADNIVVDELPVPAPGPTDVLVRVGAATVNQVDTYIRAGRYPTLLPFPFVVGRDLVGTVEATGPGAGFEIGETVWCNSLGHGGRQGSCSEFAVVSADRLYRLPQGADAVASVAVFHPAATAYLALHKRARVRDGQTVLVGGAAGSVGSAAVQFAAAAGTRVLATARPRDYEFVRGLGAAEVFDFEAPDVIERVRAAAPDGVDLHWDTSGHTSLAAVSELVATRGRILVTAGREHQRDVTLWPLYTRDVSVIGFVISLATVPELAEAAEAVNRRLDGAGFGTRIAHVLPLARTADGHRLVESGASGRVVIHPV